MSSAPQDGKRGHGGKLLAGIVTAILAPLLIWYLTKPNGPLNPPGPPPDPEAFSGQIVSADLTDGNPCCTFNVRVSIQGFKGKTCTLCGRLADAYGRDEGDERCIQEFEPDAQTDEAAWEGLIPISYTGTYYVRFTLYDPNNTQLDTQATEQFVIG
jgi:hypothetical protein